MLFTLKNKIQIMRSELSASILLFRTNSITLLSKTTGYKKL